MRSWKLFEEAIKKGIRLILLEEPLNNPEESERRWNVCKSNAGDCYDSKNDRCKYCSCYMESKVEMLQHKNPKAKFRTEVTHCPLAKWGKADSEDAWKKELEIANYYRDLDKKELLT